jgi:hypothetical protein
MKLDLPDLDDMRPEDWLRRLDQIRDRLVGELAELLRTTDDPATLADELDQAFGQLRRDGADDADASLAIVVSLEGDDVVCRHDGAQTARRLNRENDDWHIELEADRQLDEHDDSTDDTSDHHRRLARRLLELLPWWSKHAFTPISRT